MRLFLDLRHGPCRRVKIGAKQGMSDRYHTNWFLVFALWGAGLGAAAQYGKVSVVFDQLPGLFPDAGAQIGFAVSLVGLIGIVFGVVAGLLVARIRYRRTLIWALWIGALVSLLQSFLPPFNIFLGLRALEGISHLGMVVAAPTLIAQLCAPRHRGFALTLWGTFFGVAFAVLNWGGLPLVDRFGVSGLFLAHSLYMAVFAVVMMVCLKALSENPPVTRLSVAGLLADHVAIYRSPRIAAPAAGWLFYTFTFVSVLTVLPPFIAPDLRVLVMGAMPLASILSSLTLGVWLLQRRSAVWVIQLGFALSVLSLIWLWITPGAPLACLALAASMGLVQGASFAAVPQLNADAATQAQANGALAQMGNLGNTLGTPVMAVAVISLGYAALPILSGVAMLAGLLVHILLASLRRAA